MFVEKERWKVLSLYIVLKAVEAGPEDSLELAPYFIGGQPVGQLGVFVFDEFSDGSHLPSLAVEL